jgi:hypothetical protein
MNMFDTIKLICAFIYALLPYFCIIYIVLISASPKHNDFRASLPVSVAACALFALVSALISRISFDLYLTIHAALIAIALPLFILIYRKQRNRKTAKPPSQLLPLTAIMAAAFLIRLIPMLGNPPSLGGGDAVFHNILAKAILQYRILPATWVPFADIPVTYPRGPHCLAAFMTQYSGLPLHFSFNILIAISGMLTTAIIYLISDRIFRQKSSALLSAACYAFLASWGSLDYYRWGGLPNSLGMLLLCLLIYLILLFFHKHTPQQRLFIPLSALLLPAIAITHHYTMIVAFIFLAAGIIFAADNRLRKILLQISAIGLLLTVPLIFSSIAEQSMNSNQSNIFVFRESIITIIDCILSMNPAFVLLFAAAMATARKSDWNSGSLLILTWLTALFAAFVALEYIYRAGSLIITSGSDCFTCLTPSRMATDLVYPMSILCGFLTLSDFWKKRYAMLILIISAAAILNVSLSTASQFRIGRNSSEQAAARWIAVNTPQNCMIAASAPHLEYIAWRSTSNPPIPASEGRNHPDLVANRQRLSLREWIKWSILQHRPVYFLFDSPENLPLNIKAVYSSKDITIAKAPESNL